MSEGTAPKQGPRDLTQGPVGKTLLLFTLPTLGSNILQSLNSSISAVYVGQFLGKDAFAAAGTAAMVMFLIFSTVFGLAMAATIMIGQAMGRRDMAEVRRITGATAGTFIIASLFIAVLGGVLTEPILHALSTPKKAFPHAVAFLSIVFPTIPLVFIMVLLQSALRGVGDAVTPLWSTILNLILSLILNPIFIVGSDYVAAIDVTIFGMTISKPFWFVGFLNIPAMGLRGAALAGALTNFICLSFIIYRIYRLDLPMRLRGEELRLLRPDWAHLKPVLTIGLPMGLSMIIMSLSSLVMVGLINREGLEMSAAYNASTQIWNYIQMPAFAVGSAVSAMAAQNIGAGRWDRISQIARTGVMTNVILTGVLVGIMLLAGSLLMNIFLPGDSEAIALGKHINLLIGWTFIPMGISMVLTSVVRANGAVIAPFVILVVSVILVRLSIGFGLHPSWGAEAIWWAFIASSTTSALMGFAYYVWGDWRKPRIKGAGRGPSIAAS